jgi:hypothetical protein
LIVVIFNHGKILLLMMFRREIPHHLHQFLVYLLQIAWSNPA